MRVVLIMFLFFWASLFKGEAQTFIWESEPEGSGCDLPFIKIKETKSGEFFIIGVNNCKVGCMKLNKFGNLDWRVTPKTFSRELTDFVSFDEEKSFYVIGIGNVFPSRSMLFQISLTGDIYFEREIYSLTYYPLQFCNKLYKNQIVTCGYRFYPNLESCPIVEFRGLNGDTLGKTEINDYQYKHAKKIFISKDKPGFLLFCGHAYKFLTTIYTDTLGNKISAKVYGTGEYGYQTFYRDLIEKDSSYYLLGDLSFYNTKDKDKGGAYIYRFNYNGDSVGLNFIESNSTLKAIAPTKDNGFIVAGDVLLKLDSNYKVQWRKEFKKYLCITSVGQSLDGGYYGAGSIFDEAINRSRTYVFKTDENGEINASQNYPDILIYPNPVNDELRIDLPFGTEFSISIFNVQGVNCMEFLASKSTLADLRNLTEGIYFLVVKNKEGIIVKTQKIFKL